MLNIYIGKLETFQIRKIARICGYTLKNLYTNQNGPLPDSEHW